MTDCIYDSAFTWFYVIAFKEISNPFGESYNSVGVKKLLFLKC